MQLLGVPLPTLVSQAEGRLFAKVVGIALAEIRNRIFEAFSKNLSVLGGFKPKSVAAFQ